MIIRNLSCLKLNRGILSKFQVIGTTQFSSASLNNSDSKVQSFIPVYRFPFVTAGALLNKVKSFQLCVLGGTLPLSVVFYLNGFCDGTTPLVYGTVGFASTVALFGVGQLFTQMIGYVYLTQDLKEVKLSYLDFWGRRKDTILSIDEIKPLSSSKKHLTDYFYLKVHTFSSGEERKLSIRFGEILHTKAFNAIFKFDVDKHL